MRIALAQMDPVTGDLEGNLATVLAFCELAQAGGAELVVFPPHTLDGDPSETVSMSAAFMDETDRTLKRLSQAAPLPIVLGCTARDAQSGGLGCQMAYFVSAGDMVSAPASETGSALAFKYKSLHFEVRLDCGSAVPKDMPDCLLLLGAKRYRGDGSIQRHLDLMEADKAHVVDRGGTLVRVQLVGGFDDKVCRGASYAISEDGQLACSCTDFAPDLVYFEVGEKKRRGLIRNKLKSIRIGDPIHQRCDDPVASMWRAVVRATRDYLVGNGFTDCLIGLSGGIDSAVVATIAADAIGPEHVHVLLMPSPYSSQGSVDDALALVENLGLDGTTLAIDPVYGSSREALGRVCGGEVSGIADENLQARIRTLYLMTVSNTYGWVLLNTGNKSEGAMGFSTLYGDTAGAFAPLGDVYKTRVFELARFRNTLSQVIPEQIITKPPSAELHENQRDDDRLPAYELLDPVLQAHVEGAKGRSALIEAGFDPELVDRILPVVSRYEFKRRQEPVSPTVSEFSFSERGWPLTNRFIDKTGRDE